MCSVLCVSCWNPTTRFASWQIALLRRGCITPFDGNVFPENYASQDIFDLFFSTGNHTVERLSTHVLSPRTSDASVTHMSACRLVGGNVSRCPAPGWQLLLCVSFSPVDSCRANETTFTETRTQHAFFKVWALFSFFFLPVISPPKRTVLVLPLLFYRA